MNNTSQDKTPATLNREEAICQPIAISSPVQSPPVCQQRIICCEQELSDQYSNSNSTKDTGLFPRPTKSDPVNSKTDSVVLNATLLDEEGVSEDGGYFQKCGGSNVTTALYHSSYGSFSQSQKGITSKSESPDSESPLMYIRCPFVHKARLDSESNDLTISSVNYTNQDEEQLVSECVTTDCGRIPRIAGGLITHPHCSKGVASELVGVCTTDAVTLWRSENESFGLNLEITSSPLKVVITGLKPGGAAERVSLIGFTFILGKY